MRTRRLSSGILKTFWKLCRLSITKPPPSSGSTSTRPPSASIFVRADSLTACARTVSACAHLAVAEDLHAPAAATS